MLRSTIIARVSDGLPLAASIDDEQSGSDLTEQKQQAKAIFKRLNVNSESRASIESSNYLLHYMIESSICYLCICDAKYPRKQAFAYLDDIATEFSNSYGESAMKSDLRPYAYVQFDDYMRKAARVFSSSRTADNLERLNSDLQDVTKIMTKNIEDLLYRGDSLDRMSDLSNVLRDESRKYKRAARTVNLKAMWQQYGPFLVLGLLIIIVFYWKFFR